MRRLGIVRQVSVVTIGAVLGALLAVAVQATQATPAFAAAPTITSLSPQWGTWQGGVVVTIVGTGFTTVPDTTVTFGGVPGTVTSVNATQVVVTSPANPSTAAGTSVPVVLSNSGGTTVATNPGPTATWVNGSTCLNGTFTGDLGDVVSGVAGLPANALITAVGGSRSDTTGVTVTSGSATVLDTHILASDQGRPVSSATAGAIPANTFVGTVTAGTSFLLSSSPTSQVNVNAGAAATSVVVGCAAPNATLNAPVTTTQGTATAVTLTLSFTYPSCTFNSQIAGAVLTVVPGVSTVPISCTRLQGGSSFVMALVSSVAGVVTPFSVSADESLIMNNSPTLPPSQSSDTAGNMTFNLPVPAKTTGGNPGSSAVDPDGTCPPTQFTVNQGLFTCAVAVANLSGVNFGNALLEYPGQLSPQTPTLSLSQTGSSATTITATGDGWWGTGPDSSSIPAANIRIGCTGTPCTGGQNAVSSNLTASGSSYFINCSTTLCTGNFQPSRLSGTFTIPTGATGTVAIDQATREPAPCAAPQNCFPGNGPGRTDAATVTSGSDNVLDASIKASDTGNTVTGTGIPAGTFVGTVTAGTSFLLSSSATSQVNVNATASGTSVVLGTSVEATAPGVATATASGTGVATWLGNDPNNAIGNSSSNPNPNQWWQPVAAATAPLTYTVTLPAPTTISAVNETWFQGLTPPTGWTVDTSTTGPTGTFTTQVTVSGNTSKLRNDVFPNGQVPGVNAIRLNGITGFGAPCTGCGWAPIALVKFGWDGHGVVFPQATSPNTTPWRVTSSTPVGLINPGALTHVTVVGVTGATPYSYRVTAVNGNGETLPSPSFPITTGPATLSATNYNLVEWNPVPSATSYNVYRGSTAGTETFLTNVPASATTCPPNTAPIPPCLSDTGTATPAPPGPPADPGTVESTALANPGANAAFFWQPTSAAAAGADYEVDLGPSTVLSSATPTWAPYFTPPSAYEIDTSNNGTTWSPQFTTTTNTSRTATDEFPGGQVTANYIRVQINAPFPAATGAGFAGVALNQFSWNGVAATATGTPPGTSLTPQGYYPATLPNSATANTTTTWNAQSPTNGLSGGSSLGRVDPATVTSGSPTVTDANIQGSDNGHPVTGTGIPANTFVGTVTVGTSFLLSSSATSQVNVNATAAGTSVTIDRRIIGGSTTCCSMTSGSGVITATAAAFFATDVGRPIRGAGIPLGAIVTTFTSTTSITVSANATATASGVLLSLGGNSWWQPAGASGNTGNLAVAFDLGFPTTVNSVTTSWLTANFCPGHGTCTGFEGINYQIFTSPNGTQNSWTLCKTVTGNAAFTTADSCTSPATGAQYVEFLITSWNSTTPFSASDGYGPGFNSILIQ